jgi:hypothetical protein
VVHVNGLIPEGGAVIAAAVTDTHAAMATTTRRCE